MKQRKISIKKRAVALFLATLMCLSTLVLLASCSGSGGSSKPGALVIMTESLDGLFNPF